MKKDKTYCFSKDLRGFLNHISNKEINLYKQIPVNNCLFRKYQVSFTLSAISGFKVSEI